MSSDSGQRSHGNNTNNNMETDSLWRKIKIYFKGLIDLREGMDQEGTIVAIKDNRDMVGSEAWLLIASILLASFGLDQDSTAVVIGAMLISPLMGPILGIGLSVGINDRKILNSSLIHFGVAIIISLITSTLYFLVTPFGDMTPNINARTMPTVLDVGIAFFGGIAGIVSGTRKNSTNAIPGVAIATALMPPICVTGFGLANMMQYGIEANNLNYWNIATNSFYLFFMNSTFIALATYLIVRFLRFPYVKHAEKSQLVKAKLYVSIFAIITIVPSAIILSGVLKETQQKKSIKQFVTKRFPNAISKTSMDRKIDSFDVKIFLFKAVENDKKIAFQSELSQTYGVPNARLHFIQTDIPDMQEIENSVRTSIMQQLEVKNEIESEKEKQILSLSSTLDSLNSQNLLENSIESEILTLFPSLNDADLFLLDTLRQKDNIPLLLLDWKPKMRDKKIESRLYDFVKLRAKVDTLDIGQRN